MKKIILILAIAVYSAISNCMESNSPIQNFLLAQQIEQHNINQLDFNDSQIIEAEIFSEADQELSIVEAEVVEQPSKKRRLNDNSQNYKCDYENCNYSTAYKYSLKVHKRTHTGERPYTCDYDGCGKAFRDSSALIRHKRTHSGEKPYACDYPACGKVFNVSTILTQHKRIHTGEKPFVCNYDGCSKAFRQPNGLIYHRRTHTGEKPFKCPHCDYAAAQQSNLNQHLNKKHPQ